MSRINKFSFFRFNDNKKSKIDEQRAINISIEDNNFIYYYDSFTSFTLNIILELFEKVTNETKGYKNSTVFEEVFLNELTKFTNYYLVLRLYFYNYNNTLYSDNTKSAQNIFQFVDSTDYADNFFVSKLFYKLLNNLFFLLNSDFINNEVEFDVNEIMFLSYLRHFSNLVLTEQAISNIACTAFVKFKDKYYVGINGNPNNPKFQSCLDRTKAIFTNSFPNMKLDLNSFTFEPLTAYEIISSVYPPVDKKFNDYLINMGSYAIFEFYRTNDENNKFCAERKLMNYLITKHPELTNLTFYTTLFPCFRCIPYLNSIVCYTDLIKLANNEEKRVYKFVVAKMEEKNQRMIVKRKL